jgi:hypothetical protein
LLDPIVVDYTLEEQFRSEFSEDEYSEGVTAKEQDLELPMENDDIYKEVHMVVRKTRESLSQNKNILQYVIFVTVVNLVCKNIVTGFMIALCDMV